MAKARSQLREGNVGILLIIIIVVAAGLYVWFNRSVYQSIMDFGVATTSDIKSDGDLMAASSTLDSSSADQVDATLQQNDADVSAF